MQVLVSRFRTPSADPFLELALKGSKASRDKVPLKRKLMGGTSPGKSESSNRIIRKKILDLLHLVLANPMASELIQLRFIEEAVEKISVIFSESVSPLMPWVHLEYGTVMERNRATSIQVGLLQRKLEELRALEKKKKTGKEEDEEEAEGEEEQAIHSWANVLHNLTPHGKLHRYSDIATHIPRHLGSHNIYNRFSLRLIPSFF
tara:strand:- start:200 stop:811 length:612 start_codon:yes stop_codon:yes gene_type:complete